MGRTTVSLDDPVYERLDDTKNDDENESFSDVVTRALDALESEDGDCECNVNALTENHIDDIVTQTSDRAAEKVVDQLHTR